MLTISGGSTQSVTAETVEFIKARTRRGHVVEPARIRFRRTDGTFGFLVEPGLYSVASEEAGTIAIYELGPKARVRYPR